MAGNVELDDHGRGRTTGGDSSGGAGAPGGAARAWDCGSALYDSYELAAFTRQLDAALLGGGCRRRSLSMPRLSSSAGPAAAPPARRGGRRLPALLRRLFSKVLRLRRRRSRGARYGWYFAGDGGAGANSATGSPWSGALASIPEEISGGASPEKGSSSPPVAADGAGRSVLRKAKSERFTGSKTASSLVQFEVLL